tara:strand:- start:81 stop:725 length:645 start_codon:yes stop_codon:yes gene_type:complete
VSQCSQVDFADKTSLKTTHFLLEGCLLNSGNTFQDILTNAMLGVDSARSELFEKVHPEIERYLSQQASISLKRKIQVDDLCQEVFLRALKVIDVLGIDSDYDDFLKLVLQNAKWTVLDAVKSLQKFEGESNIPGGIVSIPVDIDLVGGEVLAIQREESEWLHSLIDELDDDYSSVMWLKLDGKSTQQISEQLSISTELVRKRYQRAVEKIQSRS